MRPLTILRSQSKYPAPDQNTGAGSIHLRSDNNPPDTSPGGPASAAAVCKRPGCGNPLPGQDRGRARQFCGDDCARRYHNGIRVPAPAAAAAPADIPADPLAALETVIRQAVVLTRAARETAAGLDP